MKNEPSYRKDSEMNTTQTKSKKRLEYEDRLRDLITNRLPIHPDAEPMLRPLTDWLVTGEVDEQDLKDSFDDYGVTMGNRPTDQLKLEAHLIFALSHLLSHERIIDSMAVAHIETAERYQI